MAIKILKFVQKTESDNYYLKIEILIVLGKFFKNQRNFEKAIITYEECYHLSDLNDDLRLKIKSLISLSSCYLEMSDLHKVIYYYHKLIDFETLIDSKSLVKSSSSLNTVEIINLELRVAIRQNLFIAHYKLGKLRICCYYLDQIINLIDKNCDYSRPSVALASNSFDFFQIKIDASIELCKLYYIFGEFILMKSLLDKILYFIENIIDKSEWSELDHKHINSLRYFKIKCYSHLGICLAGLRDFRLSKLGTRKSLCLIDAEFLKPNCDLSILNSLKIECLLDAVDASNQILKTYKEMQIFCNEPMLGPNNSFDQFEINDLIDLKLKKVDIAKNAYFLAKSVIDPSVKSQTAFVLAKSLYENGQYQSAAYYFSQVIKLHETHHQNKNGTETLFYSDTSPDYKLESYVYLCKCQLLTDYYEVEFSPNAESKTKPFNIDMENLYEQMIKSLEQLIKYYVKWRLHETNRCSFEFNSANLEFLKQENNSNRLRLMLNICSECLIYICYKLKKLEECLIYMELEYFVIDCSFNDLIDLKLIDMNNQLNFDLLSFNNFLKLIKLNETFLIRYKFVFESKILFIFLIDGNQTEPIVFHTKIKTSLQLESLIDKPEWSLFESKFDFVYEKIEQIQNERIKSVIQEFEYRGVMDDSSIIAHERVKNRTKEKKYFQYMNESKVLNTFHFESIDILNVKLSEECIENFDDQAKQKFEHKMDTIHQVDTQKTLNLLTQIIQNFFITPIQNWLGSTDKCYILLCDVKYTKLVVYIFNLINKNSLEKIKYLVLFDSYVKYAKILNKSEEKDQLEYDEFERNKKEIVETPRRFNSVKTNFDKVHVSQIIPRLTSHPRAAINLLNERIDSSFVPVRNDHFEKIKDRLDGSVNILITETVSGTNAKRSNLDVIEYRQVFKQIRCCVMGCPDVPKKIGNTTLKINRFLKKGLEQLVEIATVLKTEAIFGHKFTKKELFYQLETNSLIFLSTVSNNESDSYLICSQSSEVPSSYYEFEKYCKLTCQELDLIDMHQCNLLILNCYSALNNNPRYDLAKKILSRGCKSVLVVLTPLEDNLMTLFYRVFLKKLKKFISIENAYCAAMQTFCELNPSMDPVYLNNSFVLISIRSIQVSIDQIIKSMEQLNINKTLNKYLSKNGTNGLNGINSDVTILSPNYVSNLEKNLIHLQILIKFLLNDFIRDSEEKELSNNIKYDKIFNCLSDQIARSIYFIKSNKVGTEQLDEILEESFSAQNLLKCLGFGIQMVNIFKAKNKKDKKVLIYPGSRYLDLNLRMTHVMSALVDMCFRVSDVKLQLFVYNLEALLPIEDKKLLKCLIDILALTKFSHNIVLNSTDNSIYYALNYYEHFNDKRNFEKFFHLINKDFYEWNIDLNNGTNDKFEILASDLCSKYSIGNKIVNLLISIGYEIIGTLLRFNESDMNKNLLDLCLKFFSSFTIDRDMSLYKELNIHVFGQRSAVTRGLTKTASNLNKNDTARQKDDEFKVNF